MKKTTSKKGNTTKTVKPSVKKSNNVKTSKEVNKPVSKVIEIPLDTTDDIEGIETVDIITKEPVQVKGKGKGTKPEIKKTGTKKEETTTKKEVVLLNGHDLPAGSIVQARTSKQPALIADHNEKLGTLRLTGKENIRTKKSWQMDLTVLHMGTGKLPVSYKNEEWNRLLLLAKARLQAEKLKEGLVK